MDKLILLLMMAVFSSVAHSELSAPVREMQDRLMDSDIAQLQAIKANQVAILNHRDNIGTLFSKLQDSTDNALRQKFRVSHNVTKIKKNKVLINDNTAELVELRALVKGITEEQKREQRYSQGRVKARLW